MTATDPIEIKANLDANPDDATLRLVYADSLEESGKQDLADWHRMYVKVLATSTEPQREQLKAQLERANGRRRTRTLNWNDVIDCCIKAMLDKDGWWAVGGGKVANAYGYAAKQTVCVAVKRTDGTMRIGIVESNASKGASLTAAVTGLAKNAKPEAFRQWADAQK